jgi:type VI secretion system protein
MTLRLSVVSEHGIRLGALSTKVFGVHGGSIGRSTDNEWILPDPERYLSGKHARIDVRAGSYVLVDTSSNGTYVNGAQVPLGKYHDYSLKDGDYVRLGEYELLVSIDKNNDFPPDHSAIVAYDGQAPSSAVKKSTANDLGEDLDLSQLLEPSDILEPAGDGSRQPSDHSRPPSDPSAVDSGVLPRDAYGQTVGPRRDEPRSGGRATAGEEGPGTPWHMTTRPLKVEGVGGSAVPAGTGPAATPAPRAPVPALYDGDFDTGLSAFCRGAGVDPRTITPEARASALQLAGQLLREAVVGLMDLNHSRNEFRSRFRIDTPPADGPESPLNLSRGADEALVRLLTTTSTRAGSVEAIRGNFRELKAQHTAALSAMHVAFEEFLGRVDPKELEERFDRATKRGVFGTQNKGKYWDLYAEMFTGLAQRPAGGYPHLFTEAFAKGYEAKLRLLIPPRRSSFGADRQEEIDKNDRAVGDP